MEKKQVLLQSEFYRRTIMAWWMRQKRRPLIFVFIGQVAITLAAVVIFSEMRGGFGGFSALIGGLAVILPAALMARSMTFSVKQRQSKNDPVGEIAEPKVIAQRLVRGVMLKFSATALIFFVGVFVLKAQAGPLLLTFVTALLPYWLALLIK